LNERKTIALPLPNQENKSREEMWTSTHELSLVQTYDPIVQVEKSVNALESTAIVIGSQNNFAGMEISSTQYWPFSNGSN
jgi:hypothetical protein